MSKPLWFLLIEQWKLKEMGSTGITLPFLVGAFARIQSKEASVDELRGLLKEIVTNPVSGYVTEVRWCHNVNAPVLSVSKNADCMPFKSHFSSSTGEASFGFSQDVQSEFGGLGCNNSNDCLEKLVAYSSSPIEAGHYSRVRNQKTGEWEYSDFLPKELLYIEEVAVLAGG